MIEQFGFKPFPSNPKRWGRRSILHPGMFLTPNIDEIKPTALDPDLYVLKLHLSEAEVLKVMQTLEGN